MIRTNLYLKTQAQLQAECQARLTDSNAALATPAQYLTAINEAILMWHGRVTLPKLYSLGDAFTSGVYEYALPSYVNPPFDVQIRSTSYVYASGGQVAVDDNDTNQTWHSLVGYTVEPTANGGWMLRLPMSPSSNDGRILFWGPNGPMPTTAVTLTSTLTSSSTSIAITVVGGPDIAPNGWIKIENEWISYGDITRTSATSFTLLNCVRGLFNTVAAAHNSAVAVVWGVGADDQRLWINIYDYVTFFVHALQIHKGTSEDVSRHEKLVSFYDNKHTNFWRTQGYTSQRKASRNQTSSSLGVVAW